MTRDTPSEIAAHAVIWSLLADVAKERLNEARARLNTLMGPDAAAVKAVANGETIGRATWVEGKPKPVVADPCAFQAFVEEHYPDEMLTAVNPAFQMALLGNATVVDEIVVDRNGLPIPGVHLRQPDAYVSVRKTPEARATVEALLTAGRLQLGGITPPQLTEGDEDVQAG